MASKVSVVVVHGTGAGGAGYSAPLLRDVLRAIPKDLRCCVQFGEVCWSDIVRGRQNGAFMRAQEMGFYLTPVRRFLTSMLGDVAAYRKSYHRTNTPYFAIQDRITDALTRLDDDPDQALVFCGHGLGCHIISTYVWDLGQIRNAQPQEEGLLRERGFGDEIERLRGATPFCRLETLAGLFTFGNIAPLFVSGFRVRFPRRHGSAAELGQGR
jgi:hypothetical protein